MKMSNLPHKAFKETITRMLTEFGRMEELGKNFNKDLENIWKNKSELKKTITEIKNIEGINSRLDNTEEWKSDLEDRRVEITQPEQQKKKEFFKLRTI